MRLSSGEFCDFHRHDLSKLLLNTQLIYDKYDWRHCQIWRVHDGGEDRRQTGAKKCIRMILV